MRIEPTAATAETLLTRTKQPEALSTDDRPRVARQAVACHHAAAFFFGPPLRTGGGPAGMRLADRSPGIIRETPGAHDDARPNPPRRLHCLGHGPGAEEPR